MPKRKARFFLLTQRGTFLQFNNQRKVIEEIYGCEIPREVWRQILTATTAYKIQSAGEKTALEPRALRLALTKLVKSARRARNEFRIVADPVLVEFRKMLIQDSEINEAASKTESALQTLFDQLGPVVVACEVVLQNLPILERFVLREGDLWNAWVNTISELVRKANLPYRVSKDASKRKSGKESPFVYLIHALHDLLPPESRRHDFVSRKFLLQERNLGGLAAAIIRARK
jgi:hypothetical protein